MNPRSGSRRNRIEWLIATIIQMERGTDAAVDYLWQTWGFGKREAWKPINPAQAYLNTRRAKRERR